jgi:hypothetical protein
MRAIRYSLLLLGALAGACSPVADAQRELALQARAGVEQLRAASTERRALVSDAQAMRRRALDSAFDLDVRVVAAATQPVLSPEWVITARQAYAAGLDALAQQQAASREADAVTEANFAAVARALEQLQALAEAQQRWAEQLHGRR